MDILGVGAGELILIFIIMVVVAGPKRMLAWSYQLGKYVSQFRAMFDETMKTLRKEFEDAQIDLPKEMPKIPNRRFDIVQEANKVISTELNRPTTPVSTTPAQTSNPVTNGSKLTSSATTASAAGSAAAAPTVPPTASPAPTPPAGNSSTSATDEKKYDAWLPN